MFIEVNLQRGLSCEGALNPGLLESSTSGNAVALEKGEARIIRKVFDNRLKKSSPIYHNKLNSHHTTYFIEHF